jgi:hypothetical protein
MQPCANPHSSTVASPWLSGNALPVWLRCGLMDLARPDNAAGTRIATCGNPSGGASRIINPDDGGYQVVPNPDPANLFLPCGLWSRDGARLACEGFGLTDPSLNGIYTIRSSDGGGLVRVTSTPGGDDIPGESSPDGKGSSSREPRSTPCSSSTPTAPG